MNKTESPSQPVVILGGGLAGISAAYHLKNLRPHLFEKEKDLGGLARSFNINGFTFDFTGHLLHLHHPYTKRLVRKLLKGNFYSCIRKSSIYSYGKLTRYPFQANTFGLPQPIIDECVLEFFDSLNKNKSQKVPASQPFTFKTWSEKIFGKGISNYFMIPYNQKLFQTPANKMTVEWCGPFVPRPAIEDVVRGALIDQTKHFGYNATFLYPKKGGIQVLPKALSRGLSNIHLNTTITKIDWKRMQIRLSSKIHMPYQTLINTIPLTDCLKLMQPLPVDIKNATAKLRSVGVLCLNLGVNRPRISDQSWIYFPERKYPFYRVGFPMNFTPYAAPRGSSSMYVEIPFKTAKRYSKNSLMKKVRSSLIECGILQPSDRIITTQFLPIPHAYVIYDKHRGPALKKIFQFLTKYRIQSIGRYGGWKYSFMEEAILDGKKAAEKYLKRNGTNLR